MSRSAVTRSNFRRSCHISSSRALRCPTPGNACSGSWSCCCRQRRSMSGRMSRSRATCARLWPPSVTIRTASSLNSPLKLLRVAPIDTSQPIIGLSQVSTKSGEFHYAHAVTKGCGNGNFCPAAKLTRAQAAIFLVRTFNLK